MFVVIYVDEIILACRDIDLPAEIKRVISIHLCMDNIGALNYFLGKERSAVNSQNLFGCVRPN